jgi:inner membrane protein
MYYLNTKGKVKMDPITHSVSGLALAKVFKVKLTAKKILIFGSLALLPDIDNIVSFGSRTAYLLHHRGFTHSVWGGLLLGILSAFILKNIFNKNLLFSIITSIAIMYIHIYLDYITSYGTQLLAPFSRHRFALSTVYIIDPFYTLTIIILLTLGLLLKSRKTAIIAAAFLILYPAANFGVKTFVKFKVSKLTDDKVIVTTTAFTPIYWKVIIEDKNTYKVKDITTFGQINLDTFTNYTKFDRKNSFYNFNSKFLDTYLWFVDYPVIIQTDGNYDYEIFDLKFMLNENIFDKNKHKAFGLQFKTNGEGEMTDYIFN